MSSAVEVLRIEYENVNDAILGIEGCSTLRKRFRSSLFKEKKQYREALKEALLALGRLDRLEKWLDKKIKTQEGYNEMYWDVRTNILKEVREVLK